MEAAIVCSMAGCHVHAIINRRFKVSHTETCTRQISRHLSLRLSMFALESLHTFYSCMNMAPDCLLTSLRVGFCKQPNNQTLLGVQTVFSFVDDQAAAAFDDLGRDLFTSPCR